MDTSKSIKVYQINERTSKGGFVSVYLVQKENNYYAL